MKDDTLSRFVDAIPNSVMVIDHDYGILAANKAALGLTGADGIGVDTLKCHKILRNADEPCDTSIRCPIRECISTGVPVTLTQNHCIGGSRSHEVHVAPFKEEPGKATQFVMSCRDNSGHEQAGDDRIRLLVENMVDMVSRHLADSTITYVSPSCENLLGYRQDELLNVPAAESVHPDDIDDTKAILNSAISMHDNYYRVRHRIRHKDGRYIWVETIGRLVYESDGSVSEIQCNVRDISERKQAEEALRESEETFRSIVESSPMGIHIYQLEDDERLVFMGANPAADRLLGMDHQEFVGKTIEEAFPPLAETEIPDRYRRAARHGKRWFTEQVNYDHGSIAGAFEVSVFRMSPGKVAALFNNITERKRVEGELQKLAAAVKYSAELVNLATLEGKMVFLNEAGGKMLGIDPQEVGDINIMQVIPEHLVELVESELLPALTRGDIWEGDLQYINLQTGKLTDVHAMTFPVKDPDTNEPQFLANVSRDITERKLAEEERLSLERQVQRAQKMESLGVLAGGIAHDFNNLLMGVLGNADLALINMTPEAPGRDNIYNIQTAAEKAADLAKQMLAYSGKGRFVVKRMELQFLVEEMVHLLEASISKKVYIKYDFASDVPPVEADPTQMRQIIMNLMINASEAVGDRSGIISVRTGTMECDKAYLDETYLDNDLEEGVYSYFEIADNGAGMGKETIAKIFDPFFTTKFTGRGLGLAAVLGIVRGHKGTISVDSEPGKGTTFKVLLPSAKGPVSSPDLLQSDYKSDARLKGKTALLVDDEETVRIVGKEMLNALGMKAFLSEDGREALGLLKKTPDKFDFIILDLTMPHLDGEETFREMRLVKKDISVILSSGYNEQDLATRFAGKGFAGLIQKPYRVNKLKEILLAALKDKESL